MTERLTGIEERLSHLIRTVEELSDEVHAQGRRIDVLDRRVGMLMRREAEREAAEQMTDAPAADQKPPHW